LTHTSHIGFFRGGVFVFIYYLLKKINDFGRHDNTPEHIFVMAWHGMTLELLFSNSKVSREKWGKTSSTEGTRAGESSKAHTCNKRLTQ
jgi:hypothetical protein